MHSSMTVGAEGNQIAVRVVAHAAAGRLVVDFELIAPAAALAAPAVTLQDLLSQPVVGLGLKLKPPTLWEAGQAVPPGRSSAQPATGSGSNAAGRRAGLPGCRSRAGLQPESRHRSSPGSTRANGLSPASVPPSPGPAPPPGSG